MSGTIPQGVIRLAVAAVVAGGPQAAWAGPEGDDADVEVDADEPEPEPEPEAKPKASKPKAEVKAKSSPKSSSSKRKKSRLGEPAPMKGRVGLGAMRTVAGLNAIVLRGYVANRVTLGLNAGVATFTHRDVDEEGEFGRRRTVGRVGVGPELHFWPVQGDRDRYVHADFGVGLRMITYFGFLGRLEEEETETLDDPLEFNVELDGAVQLFIGQRVAILPEFGFVFRIIPGSREPDQNGEFDMNPGTGIGSRLGTTDGPGFGFEFGDHAGLFFGIGMAFFFGKPKGNPS